MRTTWALTITISIIAACSIPNVENIDLSNCMRACNASSKECINATNAKLDTCLDDALCQRAAIHDIQTCLLDGLDCISECVDELERDLK